MTKMKNRLFRASDMKGLVSGIFLLILLCVTALAGWLAPYDPYQQNLAFIFQPPGTRMASGEFFLLGTDQLGRDIFSRLLYGGRLSLLISLAAVAVSCIVGTALGILAGYFRRTTDLLVMRLADIQLSIPLMLFAIMIIAVMGSSLSNVILVLSISGWVPFARVIRSEVLALREREFVECARAMGVPSWQILLSHILPNISYTLITQATLQIARMILLAASLSFLGLGVDVSLPTWGGMISDGRSYITDAWWLSVFPGLTIAVVIFFISLFSDWLQEFADRH